MGAGPLSDGCCAEVNRRIRHTPGGQTCAQEITRQGSRTVKPACDGAGIGKAVRGEAGGGIPRKQTSE